MNSMERLQATISGQLLDRRAIAPGLGLYGARLTKCPLEQYYRDPAAYARGQAAVRDTFQPDVLFSPFDFAGLGAAFGSELQIFADQPANIRQPAIRSMSQWDQLTFPDPDTHPSLLFFRDAIRLMAAELRGQVPIAAPFPSPMDLPVLIMGMETWLETVLFDPAGTQRVMERIIPFFVRMANLLLAAGATFIDTPCTFASSAIVTRSIAADFVRPALHQALTLLNKPIVLHHGGSPMLPHLDLLAGMPAVMAYVLDHRDDPGHVRAVVGPEPLLLGGPCGPNLGRVTAAQIESECRAILEDRQQDHRFILGTSGPDIPPDTPPENIHALRKVAEACGRIGV